MALHASAQGKEGWLPLVPLFLHPCLHVRRPKLPLILMGREHELALLVPLKATEMSQAWGGLKPEGTKGTFLSLVYLLSGHFALRQYRLLLGWLSALEQSRFHVGQRVSGAWHGGD